MGLKLSNRQLKLLTELVLEESKREQNIEWDEMLNRMVEMAKHRGMTFTLNSAGAVDPNDMQGLALKIAERKVERAKTRTPAKSKLKSVEEQKVHPLFRDQAS